MALTPGAPHPAKVYNVLFLCTQNSARSIMAECLLRRWSNGRFNAWSAGSRPGGTVNPYAIRTLQAFNHKVEGLRSKSWDEFTVAGAPVMDFVFTVCDSAANEVCPVWPGQPMTAHWGVEDPACAMAEGEEKAARAFRRVYVELESRIKIFASLRVEGLDNLALQSHLSRIGGQRASDDALTQAGANN